jgi:phage N-6-adenine-methyltransferase
MSPAGERAMAKRTMHEEWETPASIFDPLHAEFKFTLDAAALPHNAKCAAYITPAQNALTLSWGERGDSIWLNPPYGYRNLDLWMGKAYRQSLVGRTVVCLVPAHTGQPWWHQWVVGKASEIRWIRGKVKFVGAASCAPFPSCIVIYRLETISRDY